METGAVGDGEQWVSGDFRRIWAGTPFPVHCL